VIAIDTNILVYAHRRDMPLHEEAATRLAELANGAAAWAIPWACVSEFLAVVTNPRLFVKPTPLQGALDQIDAWLSSPSVVLLSEGEAFWAGYRRILEGGRVAGGQVHDARIAALCVVNGVRELWTADRDFTRFAELQVRNPLVAQ